MTSEYKVKEPLLTILPSKPPVCIDEQTVKIIYEIKKVNKF